MTAYLIGHITVRDPQEWSAYVAGVARSLVPFAAEIVFRGRKTGVLAGEHHRDQVVVIAFPDQATLRAWHASEAYQKLIPIRDRAADVTIICYDA